MDELLSEIDSNISQNIKTLSFVKHKKKLLNKMRAKSTLSTLKKKFYSASLIKNTKDNNKKLISKSNSLIDNQLSSREPKIMNCTLPFFYKKNYSSKISQIQREESTSLSNLMKPNTTLFPSNNTTSFNFYNNTDNKNKDLNNENIADNNKNNISFLNNNFNEHKNNDFSFNLSFDGNTMIFLNKNINYFSSEKKINYSSKIFLEKTRIIRKAKIINDHCQNKARAINEMKEEEINNIQKIEFNHRKNKKLFYLYFKILNSYLNKLFDIKENENDKLSNLKLKKNNITRQIDKIKNSIISIKDKLNNLKEMKKFLLEVKFKKFLPEISPEIRKKYGFYEEKPKKPRTIAKKRLSFLQKMDLVRRKNNLPKKTLKIKANFNPKVYSHNSDNIPIFDEPEEFMYSINYLEDKLNENIIKYKTSRESVIDYKKNFDIINKDLDKDKNNFYQKENRLLNNLFFQKKRNNILSHKLDSLHASAINEKNNLIKIVLKLKEILLIINSKIKINNKSNLYQWNIIISNNILK